MSAHLGPFVVEEPLGQGGMGEVWLGRHLRQAVPVAVKVLREGRALEQHLVFAFREEVRSVAALSHPSVVSIYDYGEIPAAAAAASSGRLPAGSPYLVMELVRGGSLHPRCGRLPWRLVRRVLLQLLDALAHAHARGVIHRDIKPSNVLLSEDFSTSEAPGAVKLGDFGLAYATEREGGGVVDRVVGTPAFMAPEQLLGWWRDYGPWTDLYAVGCLGWALVTGAPPFGWSPSLQEVRDAQRSRELLLSARVPCPSGLEGWLGRLLEPDPGRRYRRAADAAHALNALEDPAGADEVPGLDEGELERPASARETLLLGPPPAAGGAAGGGAGRWPSEHPPLPRSWRRDRPRAGPPETALSGVGLGLFGLKAIPMVGRELERDRLWASLEAVVRSRRARTVLLRGSSGGGKSRLACWLTERAHEVGAATVLRAGHAPDRPAGEGLRSMVAHYLRCEGLEREAVRERLERLLAASGARDLEEVEALTELLQPGGRRGVRLRSPQERYALLRRVVERAAAERPVILWLEDVQWGLDALAFVSYLEATQGRRPLPVLVLLTAADDALDERALERAVLGEVLRRTGAVTVEVGPLSELDCQALVRGLLGLEGALAARLEERSGGNPLYAVQLVRDWVHRGLLLPGPRGFTLAPGADVALPEGLRDVWSSRLEQLLEGRHPDDGAALEIAAVLGLEVSEQEWRRACMGAGVFAGADLVDALLARRLARSIGPRRWAFSHAMLRELLELRAASRGRLEVWHRAAAAVLEGGAARDAERLGRHLLAAGEWRAAVQPLSVGIAQHLRAGDLRMAGLLLAARARAVERAGLAPGDPAWGEGWLLACRCDRKRGRFEEAGESAERARRAARQYGWRRVEARALLELGRLARKRGEARAAWSFLERARALGRELGDRPVLARCRMEQALVLAARGELQRAAEQLEIAGRDFAALGNADGEGYAALGLAVVSRQAGELDRSAAWLRAARRAFERAGSRAGVAECEQGLGEVARLRGQLEEAAAHYRDAWERFRAIGAAGAIFPRLYLGLLAVIEGDYPAGREALEGALLVLEEQGRQDFQGAAHAFLLPCLAAAGDWEGWDHHLDRSLALLETTGFVEVDVARAARLAGELARAAGQPRRARGAWLLALRQWRALERAREVAALERSIEHL